MSVPVIWGRRGHQRSMQVNSATPVLRNRLQFLQTGYVDLTSQRPANSYLPLSSTAFRENMLANGTVRFA
jgi:hypothetical protein